MYFLVLFLVAFGLISLITTNWPVKMYHHHWLTKLGVLLHTIPQKKDMALSSIYSEIVTIYRGRELMIRFLEGAAGSIRAGQGLEIRLKATSPAILSIYSRRHNQQEWGEFKQFQTGQGDFDFQWFILTNNLQAAAEYWGSSNLAALLSGNHAVEQMQINHDEIIVCLRRFHSPENVLAFLDKLCGAIQ
jgi:hypothetical protein